MKAASVGLFVAGAVLFLSAFLEAMRLWEVSSVALVIGWLGFTAVVAALLRSSWLSPLHASFDAAHGLGVVAVLTGNAMIWCWVNYRVMRDR